MGRILIISTISLINIGLFIFSVASWVNSHMLLFFQELAFHLTR